MALPTNLSTVADEIEFIERVSRKIKYTQFCLNPDVSFYGFAY